MKTNAFKLIITRTEVASADVSAMKGIHGFNIYSYARQFMAQHGYAGKSSYSYNIDMGSYIVHVYAVDIKEVEQL